jgi:predicted RNA-binding Zn ribbon-like protein
MNETKNWKFIGGRLCLDFVNSVGGRTEQDNINFPENIILKDKLENFNDLAAWSKETGIIPESDRKKLIDLNALKAKETDSVFKKAIELREALFRILYNVINDKEPEESMIRILTREYSTANEKRKLIYLNHKFEWQFPKYPLGPDYIIWIIAESAAELLSSDLLSRIKMCRGENCGWLFLDNSKNKSRQWCDMKDCGNLAKVRRFRKKIIK